MGSWFMPAISAVSWVFVAVISGWLGYRAHHTERPPLEGWFHTISFLGTSALALWHGYLLLDQGRRSDSD